VNLTDDQLERRRFRPRRPALLAGIGACIGCVFAAAVPGNAIMWITCLSGIGVLLIAAWQSRRGAALPSAVLTLIGLALCFAGYGALRAQPAPTDLASLYPDGALLARVEGVIIEGGDYIQRDPAAFEYPESPDREGDFPIAPDPRRSVTWLMRVESLPDAGLPATGLLKLYAPPEANLELHSRVTVLGRLRRPRRAGNPGEINSRARYELRGITHTLEVRAFTLLQAPHSLDPRRIAPWVHMQFHERIGSRMSRDRAAILGATLLGERGNLTPDQRAKFVRSGTVHLLVVSGLHVGLLAGAIVLLLRVFGVDPRHAWAVAGVAALGYLFITGLQPSVLRATSMVVIYAIGRVLMRRPDPLNVLGASALVSLAISPVDVFELGFQLSYLAVLGILVIAPCLRLRPAPGLGERPRGGRLAQYAFGSLRISAAVGLATWPLLAMTVHVVSPAMFVTNLVAAPLLTLMLALALLAPVAFIPGMGAVIALPLSLLAGLLDWIAGTFAALPFGHLFTPAPPLWWLAGYYAALLAVPLLPMLRLPRISGAVLWLLWLCVLPTTSLVSTEGPGPVRVTALDVGQGQCVVIEVPAGPCLVLDCGSTNLGGAGERVLAPYLWSRGRRQIDALFISHADADHVNGLPQVLERFKVGRVYVPETMADDEAGAALLQWLRARCDVAVLKRGQNLHLAEGLELRCLWPDRDFAQALFSERLYRNEAGLVLELRAGGRSVLMPSDVEAPGLAGVMPHLGRADVLFAPHQGSHVTGLESLLQHLRPEHIIVSARDSFPSDESMRAFDASGAKVWRTWADGAVTITIGRDGSLDGHGFLEDE
jgi:competence protein ComEC